MVEALDAAGVRRWAAACVESLDAHRASIDRINVYPVADGDTGSNLLHTLRAALESLLRAPASARSDAGSALAVLARGAVTGARGNSGVIASQMLRGMAEAAGSAVVVDGGSLAAALALGSSRAEAAVSAPVPGTMLTVLSAAAAGARGTGLHEVALSAARAAASALDETPAQLAVLAEAGVVDAGGRGVVVLLDALVSVIAGTPVNTTAARVDGAPRPPDTAVVAAREIGSELYGYEVMYLLEHAGTAAADRLRRTLEDLGDSVSVAGDGDSLWTVHVHCNDIGGAIEAGIEAGRPHAIRVARFADALPDGPARYARERAVVAPVRGDDLADLFLSEGVAVLRVDDGLAPTPYELLQVITGTGAAHVTVLPGHPDLTAIADEAAIRAVAAGQDVVVIPCASPVQALAALAVHDPRRRAGDDVVAMAEAAAATRRGEVVVAEEDAITWIGPCAAGDVLGFADGEVVLIEPGPATPESVARTATAVIDRMLAAGGELVTALLGEAAPDTVADALTGHLRRAHPEADLAVHRGGQADAVLALGLE